MRLIFALAALVLASPAEAQTTRRPSDEVDKLLQLVAASRFVEENCANYRPNTHALTELLGSSTLKPDDLETTYHDRYYDYIRSIGDQARQRESKMCDYIFDSYSDSLPELHLFVKK